MIYIYISIYIFSSKSTEPSICPSSQSDCFCLLGLLASFLLSWSSRVHVPYGLHIWWPVHALFFWGGGIAFEVLQIHFCRICYCPCLQISGSKIKCIKMKLYYFSKITIIKWDTIQIRALSFLELVLFFQHIIVLVMISLWCFDISLKSRLNMVTRTSTDLLYWASHLESIL